MSLYAIGDLHLSLASDKPMDVFGDKWENYVDRISKGFASLDANDVCVVCGDLSWGMSMEQAGEDFIFLDRLPGKKIVLKGNHDYWWTTASGARSFFEKNCIETIDVLHNNFYPYGENAAICGTRGWFFEEETGTEHDRKMLMRELGRLEASLKEAGDREKYVFMHYPPKYGDYECPEILDVMEKYSVKVCCSGHLHGPSLRLAYSGMWRGTMHVPVSADLLGFVPKKIL